MFGLEFGFAFVRSNFRARLYGLLHWGTPYQNEISLAAGLGLSTQSLKAEMRRGLVYSVAERGIDEDEGRTRLTFRYRARSWTVVVKLDGSLNDDGEPGQYRADR